VDQEVGSSNLPSCTNPPLASEISKLAGIRAMTQQRLLLSVALLLGTCSVAAAGCPNLPTAWVDPGGRPVPVYVYERAVQTCRLAAENFSGADWRSHIVACMRKRGFKPIYHDVFC
jgi:hypothetical protein